MSISPTRRTLNTLANAGYRAGVVERWIPNAKRRVDLFGAVDVLAIGHGETLAVQVTTGDHVADRVRKLQACEALPDMQAVGWRVVVQGWRKNAKHRWVCREVEL